MESRVIRDSVSLAPPAIHHAIFLCPHLATAYKPTHPKVTSRPFIKKEIDGFGIERMERKRRGGKGEVKREWQGIWRPYGLVKFTRG